MESYCTVAECEEPTRSGRVRCELHEKRWQRGARGAELLAEKAERLSPKERLLEAAARWAEADSEDDDAYAAAERAVLRAAKVLAPSATNEAIRAGLAAARARGVRLGAPPRVDVDLVLGAVDQHGSIRLAARHLGVSRNAVKRALRRAHGSTNQDCGPTNPIASAI